MKPIRIAIDNQISLYTAQQLRLSGYDIVQKAGSLPDEVWVAKALSKGAQIIISPDWDIPTILRRQKSICRWIQLPQGLGGIVQYTEVMRLLGQTELVLQKT